MFQRKKTITLILVGMLVGCSSTEVVEEPTSTSQPSLQELYNSLEVTFSSLDTIEFGEPFSLSNAIEHREGYLTLEKTIDPNIFEDQFLIVKISKHNDNEVVQKRYAKRYHMVDSKPPTISFLSSTIEITKGSSFSNQSNILSVEDEVDGSLTYHSVLEEGSYTISSDLNTKKVGTYTTTVQAMDSHQNISEASFTIIVKEVEKVAPKDTLVPVIQIREKTQTIPYGSTYNPLDNIISVSDKEDGELSYQESLQKKSYTITHSINPTIPGKYEVIVTALDSSNNQTQLSWFVTVQEQTSPSTPPQTNNTNNDTPPSGNENFQQIYQFITGTMGLNKAAACGILAHMKHESGYNPQAYNPAGYYGLCQWGGGRYENLYNWCSNNGYDPETIDGQLHFMQMELNGSYSYVLNELRNCENSADGAYQAAYVFGMRYEVSGEYLANYAGGVAQELFQN